MIELIPKEELLLSSSVPFAIDGAKTFGWRLSVSCPQPVQWIPKDISSEPVTSAILRFSDGSKLIMATRTRSSLNETRSLHFESREHASALDAEKSADNFRKKLILLDAINHLGIEIVPSDDDVKGPPENDAPMPIPSQIDQVSGGASDSFRFAEDFGVKGICSDVKFKPRELNSIELHSALDALVTQSLDIDNKFSVAVDLLRSAGKERSLRGRFLLTFGAFEALCPVQERTEAERLLINSLDLLIQDAKLTVEQRTSLRSAIGNLRRQPLRDAMLARVETASPRSQVQKSHAAALVKSAVKMRNVVAHPSHPRLPDDLAAVSDKLHLLILQFVLSESNDHAYDIPGVGLESSSGHPEFAIVLPLNAARIWYSH